MSSGAFLITDDNKYFRETLADGLGRRGFDTVLAGDGFEAIQLVASFKFRLLLFDVHMPRMGGLEALAEIRRIGSTVPCILMTGSLDRLIEERAKALNSSFILSKPFKFSALTDNIEQLLKTDLS